jgi:predicted nucleic acid-binding protein
MMRPGITLDTGALIALEAGRLAMRKVFYAALQHDARITVPAVVVAEWWRAGRREKERAKLLRSVHVEALEKHVAMAAGKALGLVSDSTTIDALVLASAALRGDTIYTSDVSDLERLRAGVPGFAHVQIAQA